MVAFYGRISRFLTVFVFLPQTQRGNPSQRSLEDLIGDADDEHHAPNDDIVNILKRYVNENLNENLKKRRLVELEKRFGIVSGDGNHR